MVKKRRRKRKPKINKYEYKEPRKPIFEVITDSFKYKKSLYIIGAIVAVVAIALIIAFKYVADNYTVTNIYVTGNTHYTDEEIVDMVIDGKLCHNSLYLSFKYRNKSIENVPFIQKMDVDILSPDTIRINVYEKAIAGYISYLGHYMYFDRDGIVVESSYEPSGNVPEVLGLSFDYVILHEKLPVENEKVFAEILDITHLLEKYELKADKMFFDSDYNVYLYFGSVEVSLGGRDYIDEKIIQLQYILPKLEGKSGVLEMKDYVEGTKNITFEEKKQ